MKECSELTRIAEQVAQLFRIIRTFTYKVASKLTAMCEQVYKALLPKPLQFYPRPRRPSFIVLD